MASENLSSGTPVQDSLDNPSKSGTSTAELLDMKTTTHFGSENPSNTPKIALEEVTTSAESASETEIKPLTPESQPPPSSQDEKDLSPESTSSPMTESAPVPEVTPAPPQPPPLQVPQTHQTYINFLFLSGRRRLMNFEPDTTIGRVKELVWGAWGTPASATLPSSEGGQLNQDQTQVEERPPAPSYLRVLYLGRMLQDDETLQDLKLPTHLSTSTSATTPGGHGHGHQHPPVSTIMHLSVRPFPPPGDGDTGKKMTRGFGREAGDPGDDANTGCCSCVIF